MSTKKENARASYLRMLSKEDLDVDLNQLSDKELKRLYVIRQNLLSSFHFPYRVEKKCDFETEIRNGRLRYVSFRDTPGVRTLTLKEYLWLVKFIEENPNMYPHFQGIR